LNRPVLKNGMPDFFVFSYDEKKLSFPAAWQTQRNFHFLNFGFGRIRVP
jgi:hypothetical protein